MRTVLKFICITIGLIAASATSLHAEQFDTTFNGTGRYLPGARNGSQTFGLAALERPDGGVVLVQKFSGVCSGSSSQCAAFTYLNSTGAFIYTYDAFGTDMDFVSAAAMDSRGRIILVGTSIPTLSIGGRNFRIQRYLPYTSVLDGSFGSLGSVEVDFNGKDDYPYAVAIDANDNIVVVGSAGIIQSSTDGDTDFGVVRLRGTNGALDTSFGGNGMAIAFFDLGPSQKYDTAKAVSISPVSGKITVAGGAYDSAISRSRVAVARFNSNGTTDSTYCTPSCGSSGYNISNGKRVYYFGQYSPHNDDIGGVAVDRSGKTYIVGATYQDNGSGKRAAIASFNANGNYLDETLDDGLGNNAAYRGVQLSDADGQRVLVSGDSGPHGDHLLLQAFNSSLNRIAGYGDCLFNTAFCFFGDTDSGIHLAGPLNLDHLGRPMFAGSFRRSSATPTESIYARFTNDTGPKPDRIFRNGFE